MQIAYSYRDRKRINEFCEENSETVKETHLKDKGKMTLSLPKFLHPRSEVILSL